MFGTKITYQMDVDGRMAMNRINHSTKMLEAFERLRRAHEDFIKELKATGQEEAAKAMGDMAGEHKDFYELEICEECGDAFADHPLRKEVGGTCCHRCAVKIMLDWPGAGEWDEIESLRRRG